MVDNKQLIALLIRHEGRRNKPYLCPSGKLTIGIGHNLDDNGLSNTIIDLILTEDIGNAVRDLCSVFPGFYGFGDARKCALISMMFMGLPAFRTFKRMIKAILVADWNTAAAEALNSTWASQVKGRATEISYMLRTNTFKEVSS